jgi:hypothetical protein
MPSLELKHLPTFPVNTFFELIHEYNALTEDHPVNILYNTYITTTASKTIPMIVYQPNPTAASPTFFNAFTTRTPFAGSCATVLATIASIYIKTLVKK